MISKELKLNKKIFDKDVEKISLRDGYGRGLLEAAEKDERVVALSADLKDSTRSSFLAEKFPDRYIECGVAEQVMVTVASGMAACGKIPFAASYGVFSPGRNWEQIRTTICINNVPVKLGGGHGGLSGVHNGASQEALEDIALMRVLPKMTVIVPCDAEEARKAVLAAAKTPEPTYIRFNREPTEVMTTDKTPFKIGRADTFWESKNPQVAIIACGVLLYPALQAAKELDKKGIESLVINCHTVKPLDERAIIRAAKTTGAIVTAEEHQVAGGLGSAVAEVLAKNFPVPIEMIGIEDKYGESGNYDELLNKYDLTKEHILQSAKEVIKRKNN